MPLNTHVITLEGPDLSGKTSLYEALHKMTDYKWNIQDRASLSMVCYARQFGRESSPLRERLAADLSNMNNRMVVLLPNFDLLEERFRARGDEIQSVSSLKDLNDIFCDEVQKLGERPNALIINQSHEEESTPNVSKVTKWLESFEKMNAYQAGNVVRDYVLGSGIDEHVIDVTITGDFSTQCSKDILEHDLEGVYYTEIYHDFQHKIEKELLGLNEYRIPQTSSSRRFYYNSDTCISSLHMMPRGKKLAFICALRSTDVVKNVAIDLKFLEFLVCDFREKYFPACEEYEIRMRLNSAHRRD